MREELPQKSEEQSGDQKRRERLRGRWKLEDFAALACRRQTHELIVDQAAVT